MIVDRSGAAVTGGDGLAGCNSEDELGRIALEVVSLKNVSTNLSVGGGTEPVRNEYGVEDEISGRASRLGLTARINESNAREVLAYLKGLPKTENTFQERLSCLRADQSLDTWQALTYPSNEELNVQKKGGAYDFKEFLSGPGIWLPEVESINHNIINNLLVKFAGEYSDSFLGLMLGGEPTEARDLVIARGAPAAGKTSYLQGNFTVAADDAKAMIKDRIKGVTNDQVHFQGTTIIQKFERMLQEKFSQVVTSDALYLTVDAIENKLNAIIESGKGQKVSVRDVQVDLITLCCRMLKRSGNEPKISFEMLSNYVKSASVNRQNVVDFLEQNKSFVKDYSLSAWNGEQYVGVARFCKMEGKIVAVDEELFDQYVTSVGDNFEIEKARCTVVDAALLEWVVDGLEVAEAGRFVDALKIYEGKTLEQALNIHSRNVDGELSVAARVLKDVLSETYEI